MKSIDIFDENISSELKDDVKLIIKKLKQYLGVIEKNSWYLDCIPKEGYYVIVNYELRKSIDFTKVGKRLISGYRVEGSFRSSGIEEALDKSSFYEVKNKQFYNPYRDIGYIDLVENEEEKVLREDNLEITRLYWIVFPLERKYLFIKTKKLTQIMEYLAQKNIYYDDKSIDKRICFFEISNQVKWSDISQLVGIDEELGIYKNTFDEYKSKMLEVVDIINFQK